MRRGVGMEGLHVDGTRKPRTKRPGQARAPRGERVVGVLGGMGPLATADFYTKLVRLTPARVDQDHPRVIIDSNPKVPDRTAGFQGQGPDPTPQLVATARALQRAGAEVIAIPCNSAHIYLDPIRRSVRIPVLDMMAEVASAAAALRPRPRAVGLLATPGTIRARLYHRALASQGIDVVDLTTLEEDGLFSAIKAVKAGDLGPAVRKRVRDAAAALLRRGAKAIVLGCTELPLVMGRQDVPVPVLDGTELLAAAAVREALPEEFSLPQRRSHPQMRSATYDAGVSVPARRR